ncbi:type II toxin-antitoxin system RelE/ParE family toxin [Halomonas sp. 18H]|nr:type II toxin-antitoxin system RelE/ParE family toxin [Halomonas sp. 18H]MCW4153010.1 type II toxin-antitoxin system RelE/ParE family toxin [Halomonas sp. 18H]
MRQLLDWGVDGLFNNFPNRFRAVLEVVLNGHWTITVNGSWRLTFTFDGEDAILVDYQDYH